MLRRLLCILGRWAASRPLQVLTVWAIAALASLAATVALLGFKTDQNDLVAADVEYNRRYLRFLDEFSDLEFLYVVIEVGGDSDRAVRVAEAVVAELEPLVADGYIESIFARVPLAELGYGLLFQEEPRLTAISRWLEANRPLLGQLRGVASLADLLRFFAGALDLEALASGADAAPAGEATSSAEGGRELATHAFRLLGITLGGIERTLAGNAVAPLEQALEASAGLSLRERGWLATENERFLIVEILPTKDMTTLEVIREPLIAVRAALDHVRERFPGVELGLTGRPVFQADEMMTTDRDMRQATIAALIGVFVLFVLFFRRLVRPLLAVATLAVAIVLTFGVVSVTIGYLTLLSIVFAAMLVGLGIDFGIHFVARYQEELAAGSDVRDAIRTTIETTGAGIGTGAVTTAAAFFTTLFVDFAGLRELGFIAGAGVLLCFVAMVTLLPALLVLVDGRPAAVARLRQVSPPTVPLLDRVSRHPAILVAVLIALTVSGLTRFGTPRYNSNLLDLQARGLESVEYEMLLIENSEKATWYAAFVVDSLAEAREVVVKLAPSVERGVVGSVESPFDLLPPDQESKLAALASGARAVADVALPPALTDVDASALEAACDGLLDALDDLTSTLAQRQDAQSRAALGDLSTLAGRLEAIAGALATAPADVAAKLAPFQRRYLAELGELVLRLRAALARGAIALETLPPILRNRFVSKDGAKYLVYAYPRKDIWDERHMQEFIDAMVAVDPDVTGTPVQVYESSSRMRDGFMKAGLYSFFAVFLLLVLDFRRLRPTLLAMVPLVVGLFWLLELMPFLGLEFNLANFFAVPILIGCGIDGGVHVVHRVREGGSLAEVGKTTGAAITLSLLTTMVGFGAMGFASHQGVASLGRLMVAGLACLLIATVVLLPAMLALAERRRARSSPGGA